LTARQRDVERDVAAREMAVDVGRGSARRGCEQHQADGVIRRELQSDGDREGGERQQQDLEKQPEADGEGIARDAAEILERQAQAQSEHDDADGETATADRSGSKPACAFPLVGIFYAVASG
jgi:hypothetical protein